MDLSELSDVGPYAGEELRSLFRELTLRVRSQIESGEEPSKLYATIANLVSGLPGVESCSLYLPSESKDSVGKSSLVGQAGQEVVPEAMESAAEKAARLVVHGDNRSRQSASTVNYHYTDIICLGAPIGSIGITSAVRPIQQVEECLTELAYYASVAFERQRLSSRLRNYLDRLEVLNDLNQLIASNIGLARTMKNLAKEVAFRFATDCAMTFILNESGEQLEIRGTYGCAPDAIPKTLELRDTILGRALRLGGIFSIPDLNAQAASGLHWLSALGVVSLHCCSLEAKGETSGVIILGFRRPMFLSESDNAMFEEFARGAGVAVANAKSQERLTSYTERLEELVQQRTADLAIQSARAEEASKAKSRFVANISHELRTPLTAIVGYSSVLADGVFGAVNDKQKDALTAITRSSEHLKELIDDVLNISRIESGKEDPKPGKLELIPLIQQIHKLMLQTAVGKGVKLLPLELSESLKDVKLWVDARHVRQILINLMSNAVKYTESGGTVQIHAEILADKAQVSVIDSGVGIPQGQAEKLFERFNRGDDSYSRTQVGTGIGLSLTKHLIEINGGKIGVESAVGKGSRFWILIPLADATSAVVDEAVANIETEDETAKLLSGLNVLIVDDNMMTTQFLGTVIQRAGGTSHIAQSVAEARKILAEQSIDAALVDLAMPIESGLDLIKHVRQNLAEPQASMPLIVVSACVFDSDQEQALNHGASFFIAKPFRPREVVKTIRHFTTASALNSTGSFRLK